MHASSELLHLSLAMWAGVRRSEANFAKKSKFEQIFLRVQHIWAKPLYNGEQIRFWIQPERIGGSICNVNQSAGMLTEPVVHRSGVGTAVGIDSAAVSVNNLGLEGLCSSLRNHMQVPLQIRRLSAYLLVAVLIGCGNSEQLKIHMGEFRYHMPSSLGRTQEDLGYESSQTGRAACAETCSKPETGAYQSLELTITWCLLPACLLNLFLNVIVKLEAWRACCPTCCLFPFPVPQGSVV